MNLSSKINVLVLLLAIVGSVVYTAITAYDALSRSLEQQIASSTALIRSQPVLAMLIYEDDKDRLRNFLSKQFDSEPVRYIGLYDPEGELVLKLLRNPKVPYELASLRALRTGRSESAIGRHERFMADAADKDHTLPSLLGAIGLEPYSDRFTDITIPVYSLLNPLTTDLNWADYSSQMRNEFELSSRYVVGYVNVGISHSALWHQQRGVVWDALVRCFFATLAAFFASAFVSWRITAPLFALARQAERVADGNLDDSVQFSASGEAKKLADMLNRIVTEISSHKKNMSVNEQLLSLKVEERNTLLYLRDQELSMAEDEVNRSKEELHRMAYFDSLTGLPNRRLFSEQLNLLMRLAKRSDSSIALLFLDLDNFKRINDSLGHSAGDLLLREVGLRLSECMRESDVLAHYVDSESHIDVSRLGGDEFTVILNQIQSTASAGDVAQRLLEALSVPLLIDGNELVISPSIGIALYPQDADNLEDLLKAADSAMYHAKDSGKNNYCYFSADMTASDMERLRLETDLRRAITRNELILHYQPQVDMKTGSVVGFEALVRWQHPERGLVPPLNFIPLAEELGLIIGIGQWVLEEACRHMSTLEATGLVMPKMAVNVSALAFSPTFVDHIREVLARTGIDPGLLVLELTEGVMMDSSSATIESLREIKDLGVGLAMDDFGTGFSSLSYLSHFPLDTLKIDRSFVVDFDKNERNRALVIAIISMARSLNLDLVAEGVETEEQLAFLSDNGVTVIQGYLFSKPVTAERLGFMSQPGFFALAKPRSSDNAVLSREDVRVPEL